MVIRILFILVAYLVYSKYTLLHEANTQKSAQQKNLRGSFLSSCNEDTVKDLKSQEDEATKNLKLISPTATIPMEAPNAFLRTQSPKIVWVPNQRKLFRLSPSQSPPSRIKI
jgi:hypothetical protein